MSSIRRTFVAELKARAGESILIRGWVCRLRVLAKTTFIVLKDCSGEAQCVGTTASLHDLKLKLDDVVEVRGTVRSDERAKTGIEIDIRVAPILNRAANLLPFNSSSDIQHVSAEIKTEYRPLALRNDAVGNVFRVQAAILKHFRDYLSSQRFTEIVSSKIVKG